MKNVVIGCSSDYNWDQLKFWVNSIKSTTFDGDVVVIVGNCDKHTIQKLIENKVIVVNFESLEPLDGLEDSVYHNPQVPIHVDRFWAIYSFLVEHPEYVYCVTTDIRDVIFQEDPIEAATKIYNSLDSCGGGRLIFSSESIKYKDEPWGSNNLYQAYGEILWHQFKNNPSYNVGVLAGSAYKIRDLSLQIYLGSINRRIGICDQATFNILINCSPFKDTGIFVGSESGWAAQCGTTVDPAKINQFKPYLTEPSPIRIGSRIFTSDGLTKFAIVHQYDRVPEWKKILEEKYS